MTANKESAEYEREPEGKEKEKSWTLWRDHLQLELITFYRAIKMEENCK